MVTAGVSPRASAAARRRSSRIGNQNELPRSEIKSCAANGHNRNDVGLSLGRLKSRGRTAVKLSSQAIAEQTTMNAMDAFVRELNP